MFFLPSTNFINCEFRIVRQFCTKHTCRTCPSCAWNLTHLTTSALQTLFIILFSLSLSLPLSLSQEDSQRYYSWRSFGPGDRRTPELWVDLNSVQQGHVRVHGILSNTHRQAARVALSFDFPFYGHQVRQITIATGGFIFTGEITHRMLTATQYIAPLMANFDPSFSKNSTVRYLDNGEVFVVQWDKVRLQGREAEGAFTFQASLHRNGTIVFGYRDVPLPVEKINSTEHPVKVGLSDAFMALLSSPQTPDARRRTIYEYHRVEVDTTKIVNRSAFEFSPLPTCLQHTTCDQCLRANLTSGCGWCNVLQRCSDGIDRHRQEWLDYSCSEEVEQLKKKVEIRGNKLLNGGAHWKKLTKLIFSLALQRHTNNYWPSMKFRNQGCHSSYAEVELGVHEKEGFIEAEQC
uniref:Plexin domain containing 1 n=1 Tax=Astyanax mexicanus TaxID=7994 RepID=A0A8B9H944_ASTMX